MQSLQNYDFMDDAARARFEELMDQLRDQLMQSYFNQMSEGMQNMTPEQMARMKDMLAELNQMLEQRERGEEPDFDGFMERYGDFFPGNPETPRRAARADGAVDGRDAAAAQLDDARAARAAAAALASRCSRTWTSAGRWTSCRATSSRRSRT